MEVSDFFPAQGNALGPPPRLTDLLSGADDSTYAERQWNLTRGCDAIKDEYVENCTALEERKNADEMLSSGPLCELCARVIPKIFAPKERITLRYSGFLHGVLTFPPTTTELLIDAVLCSYDPEIGLDRFYLTNGGNQSWVYVLENVGWQRSAEVELAIDRKFKFTLRKVVVLDAV